MEEGASSASASGGGGGGGGAAALPAAGARDAAATLRDALRLHLRARAVVPSAAQLEARGVVDGAAARAAALRALHAAVEGFAPRPTLTPVDVDGGGDAFDIVMAA
jgi:hypothetical protein